MQLPTSKQPAVVENPKFLILFGKQKSGKTTILAELPDNLIIDLEDGTDFTEAIKIKVSSFDELVAVKNALEEEYVKAGNKIVRKRISLDTATALEEIIMPYAIMLYKKTPIGKNYAGDDLQKLPNGAGYLYIREAYKKIIEGFQKYCETLILSGHVSDKQVEKDGKEMYEMELDLTGKLKRIIGARADAIGYVFRRKNECVISFKGGGDAIVESRAKHLTNKEIVISESVGEGEDMKVTVHWDRIFKNL